MKKETYRSKGLSAPSLFRALLVAAATLIICPSIFGAAAYWAVGASYTDPLKAEEEARLMESMLGVSISVMEAEVKGKIYYRVAAGPFSVRSEADANRDLLRSAGWKDAWVLISEAPMKPDEEEIPDVQRAGPPTDRSIKVGLSWLSAESFLVGTDGDILVKGKLLSTGDDATMESSLIAEISSEDAGIRVRGNDLEEGMLFSSPVRISSSSGALWVHDAYRLYGGCVEVARRPGSPSLSAANEVDIEEYLLSVLPSEIGANAPPEAFKAQAVVARTEALSSAGRHTEMGWDLCDSTHCQVFRGLYGQSPNQTISEAVKSTAGEVLAFGGIMVRTASFHSCCGGWTESCEELWGSALPHLTNVSDSGVEKAMPDLRDEAVLRKYIESEDKEALCGKAFGYRWSAEADTKGIAGRLQEALKSGEAGQAGQSEAEGSLVVTKRTARGAAVELSVSTGGGKYIIKGELNIRKLLGGPSVVKSGVFVILPGQGEGQYRIIGAGYGHGVGMCQEGAKAIARLGRDYRHILAFYYKGSSVAKLY